MKSFATELKQHRWSFLLAFGIIVLFLFLRWHQLSESFFFQNDTGRDYLELMDWLETGKPPLLGPQTSAYSLNQSAFYFYFFYPVFLLSGQSYFTTQITLSLMYVVAFVVGVWVLRKDRKLLCILLTTAALLAIHPLVVAQHRYIWNPSFVPLFLCATFFAFLKLQQNFSWKRAWVFGLSLAFTIGMSVSAVPAAVAFGLLSLVLFGVESWKLLLTTFVSFCLVFLTLLAFEVKYHFQITARALGRGQLQLYTEELSFGFKFPRFMSMLFPVITDWRIISLVSAALSTVGAWWSVQKKFWRKRDWLSQPSFQALVLFLITAAMVLLFPTGLEAHFMLGPLTLFIVFIATLPLKVKASFLGIMAMLWLQPAQLESYFHRAPRTVAETDSCFAQVCSQITEPVFVSVQSGAHNYHWGPEFRYAMKHNGCQVKYIEFEPQAAELMAVVVDNSHYTHGQTAYDELTLFGPATEQEVISCSDKLQVHLIEKAK